MTITPSEWSLLRALAWHRVMLVRRSGSRARDARHLQHRRFISVSRHDEHRASIRITAAGRAMAAKIEEELKNAD